MLLSMLSDSFRTPDDLVISLAELGRVLAYLSHDQGHGWLENPLVFHCSGSMETVEVFHSRSGEDQVTDELSFLVPVNPTGNMVAEERTIVLLDSGLI
jgi:hypothetical protein